MWAGFISSFVVLENWRPPVEVDNQIRIVIYIWSTATCIQRPYTKQPVRRGIKRLFCTASPDCIARTLSHFVLFCAHQPFHEFGWVWPPKNSPISDIYDVLEIGVLANHRGKWYILKDKKLRKPTRGAIRLESFVIYNPIRAAMRVFYPQEKPLVWVTSRIHLRDLIRKYVPDDFEEYVITDPCHKRRLKAKLAKAREVLETLQTFVDSVASTAERIDCLLRWQVPWLSLLFFLYLVFNTLLAYFVPVRYLLLFYVTKLFTNRLSNFKYIDFSAMSIISRVPNKLQRIGYREHHPKGTL
ncbi:hypothetical protein FGIG_03059 [Fasciola gigantica]|uniref:Multiple C2 domain-containing protein n=1 Tax=Fasciola gigantica TaxID=46835 RepID=A0A504YPG3_FASGI|nr:hypothetical protein FGIG_03059 [Fasciola gigantica]